MESKEFIGKKIVKIRPMTNYEMEQEGWTTSTIVFILDNGVKLFPSRDSEGNGPGCMFGIDINGAGFTLE